MEQPPMTVHQIWIGEEPKYEDKKKFLESVEKACGINGYTYRLWRENDLLSSFPRDEIWYMWKKILSVIPYSPVLASAVDYFRFKVLSLTPDDEQGLYLDADVEINAARKIPATEAYMTFGPSGDMTTPSLAFIQVYGNKAAKIAVEEADKVLLSLDPDSPTFLTSFLQGCRERLGHAFLQGKVLPRMEKEEMLAQITTPDIFCQFGQHDSPIILHHEKHYGRRGEEEVEERVKAVEKAVGEKKKKVILLMSTAKSYEKSLNRTLGLITAKDIRNVQRKTTLAEMGNADYYFIVGKGGDGLGEEERESPEFFYAQAEEGKEWVGKRFYDAVKWIQPRESFDFLFLCSDDNYIHLSRLISFCTSHQPGEKKVYGHTDEEGRATQAGILIPACIARKIALETLDSPKPNEDFGAWLKHALGVVGGEFIEDDKFSGSKGNYPAPTNGRITTHEVNPFDLVLLYGLNAG